MAEEYKVRMACHPHDPGMPPGKGIRGVDRVLGSVNGLKRFIEIAPSPYHGVNFCQGTHPACWRVLCWLTVSPSVLCNSRNTIVDKTVNAPRTKNAWWMPRIIWAALE